MKLLVVDDERIIVKGIKFNLENEGYEVITGGDGEEAVALARTERPDLIILDLMMPKLDGLDACVQIRTFSDVPIIMLTARSEDMDKLMGFECGADDYVTKPFNILELKARIKALLRRANSGKSAQAEPEALSRGGVLLDEGQRCAWKDGQQVELTAREFDLISLLMHNPGYVYSREQLLDKVWGYDYQGDYRTVDVHVRRLREKLERDSANPELILTKWGVGYYLSAHEP
ncbi:MAG: response regulator transcription factor [Clostridiales bacterium]|nr:response regulator transcription factor [Clostridiales bacterium]MCD8367921.1 response regulator transcription factor [Clostridiales bacterium]